MSAISVEPMTPLKSAANSRATMNSVNLMEQSATANKCKLEASQHTPEQPSSVKP